MTSGVPNLYATKCKICQTNVTNKEMHLANLEPPASSRRRFGFVCADCRRTQFDKEGNRC